MGGSPLEGVATPAGYTISKETVTEELRALLSPSGFEFSDQALACYRDGLTDGLQKIASEWASGALKATLDDAAKAAKTANIVQWSTSSSIDDCTPHVCAVAACLSQSWSKAAS